MKINKILYYLAVSSLVFLLFVEPYIRGGVDSDQISYLTWLLAAWLIISIFVIFPDFLRTRQFISAWIGAITVVLLVFRAVLSSDLKFELLPVSYSIVFMSSAVIANNFKMTYEEYRRVLLTLFFISLAAALYANLLALGFISKSELDIDLGEIRYSFVQDGSSMLLAISVALAVYLSSTGLPLKLLSILLIILAFLRLVTFGSKGPLIVGVVTTVLLLWRYVPRKNKVRSFIFIICIILLILPILTQLPYIDLYFDIFTSRFDNQDTGLARLSEAANDFNAFLDKPLLGWGRSVPGFNSLGEESFGHITITGTLARVGFIGTLGLSSYYILYFKRRISWVRRYAKSFLEMQVMATGLLVFVLYLFILGNPLFLFPAWAFFPVLMPVVLRKN